MSDFLQRHIRAILIGITIIYILSLAPWLIWAGALLIGATYGSLPLIILTGIMVILYPIIIIGSLLAGWRFQQQTQSKKALIAIIVPLLYIPIMFVGSIIVGMVV